MSTHPEVFKDFFYTQASFSLQESREDCTRWRGAQMRGSRRGQLSCSSWTYILYNCEGNTEEYRFGWYLLFTSYIHVLV